MYPILIIIYNFWAIERGPPPRSVLFLYGYLGGSSTFQTQTARRAMLKQVVGMRRHVKEVESNTIWFDHNPPFA
jgi:hypothetical protein